MSAYEKLLAEILGRVDEEINIKIAKDGKVIPPAELDSKLRLKSDDRRKAYPKWRDYKDAVAGLADNSGDAEQVEDEDFDGIPSDEAPEALNLMQLLKTSEDSDLATSAQDVIDSPPVDAQDLKNLTSDFEGTVKASEEYDEFYTPDINKIKSATTFDDLKNSYKKFNAFEVKAPRSMMDQFNKIDGEGLLGKFGELANFGKAIEGGKEGAEGWINKKAEGSDTKSASLKFMNYAAAYITYADMSKHISGNEAGYAFEKYLALLLSAPVLGGSNGAVDNVAKITGNNPVFMSAKFMAGSSIKGITQAIQGKEGINAVVKDNRQPVYYLSMAKLRGTDVNDSGVATALAGARTGESLSQAFDYLGLFLMKIAHDGEKYTGDLLNDKGASVLSYEPQIVTKDVKNKETGALETIEDKLEIFPTVEFKGDTIEMFKKFAKGDLGGFLIPTPVLGSGEKTAEQLATLTAAVVSDVASNLGNNIIDMVRGVYKALEATQNDTRSYVATRSGGSPNDAAKYVMDISDKYTNLFHQYGALFGTETGTAGDSVFADAGVKGAMNRNNFPRQLGVNEIKKLTEEIFKEMLRGDE